ncbi:MAG: RsmB/NOP family class I SAM-dependent RNA methyltransferase, partial [Candidatus Limnocylindrus sp.]
MSIAARGELFELAASVLRRGSDAPPLEKRLRDALRAHPELDNEGRAWLAEAVLGTACLGLRLQFQLENAGLAVEPSHLLALYLFDEHQLPPPQPYAGVLQAALGGTRFPEDAAARIAARHSLPLALARRLGAQWGEEEAAAFGEAVNVRGPITLRVNTLKTSRANLIARLATQGVAARPGALSPWSVLLDERWNLRSSAEWRAGEFEVQDEGSQVLALETAAVPGDVVIDYCAGRGGKSLALAAQLDNQGRVFAYDVA